ncbi:nuclear transport factor 2 family protein [Sphingomonas histidinilytica]|jgi:3-phenylpropionate/cinnamic acid dioxygenase small subunit|uniref:3-phenylpropionate/cinnamic acid dioxygenase, small subunit n=1 Tax=Rhizorhabdus histidinilytica TaxID=439228 RepID=A0A1T5E167_9SPHN|nr:nuclear transport factor 2 family protein [Rhizorhabdus histidinilytica]MBO9378019.1 nuclear transport factor 2 family protein [Rhizorhabdus histidinilytica]QEH80732.1 nuclear transport factor 2 family protein [Sphingomonas sp. C8-2]SKB77675.1 3-phenylpropionate/cinnamic acid dioxygenase, small subunit [Rhizorhabdus histidinilytica]
MIHVANRSGHRADILRSREEGEGMSLQELIDKDAIEQVYVRYCEIVDSKSFDRMDEVFTEDCVGDYSQALGPGVISPNRASLIASMHANLGPQSSCGATHHNVLNFRIGVDGDEARAKVHYYAVHRGRGAQEGALYSMWGQYADELRRTPAGWRVARRVYTVALTEGPAAVVAG